MQPLLQPSLDTVKTIAGSGEYRRIPVWRELFADHFTPVEVMRVLKNASCHCYLLESAEDNQKWGRFSFLGYSPSLELTSIGGKVTIRRGKDIRKGGEDDAVTEEPFEGTPQEAIRKILRECKNPEFKELPPFAGGLVGYFSYQYLACCEPSLRLKAEGEDGFRDVDLMLFDQVIAFDHYRQKVLLICGVDAGRPEESYLEAEEKLAGMARLLMEGKPGEIRPLKLKGELRPCFSREKYMEMTEKAKHYIREGDIFQVVLSNPIEAQAEGSLFDAYRVLRTTNPSPYLFYFSSDDLEMVGASPETLVKLEGKTLYTFPLAGTRPRGATEEEDRRLEEELLADEKELAEHNMLVDLGRNDIGKISQIGSVKVETYLSVQRFSHVMHLGSTVTGTIRDDRDAVDAVDAILPAGTLSGAPKLRACQIIEELEGRPRGVYGGAIGYLDFSGNLDTCIAIRLAFQKNGRVTIRSGAGIVADSVPEREYEECINKAKAVVNAIQAAEGGLE